MGIYLTDDLKLEVLRSIGYDQKIPHYLSEGEAIVKFYELVKRIDNDKIYNEIVGGYGSRIRDLAVSGHRGAQVAIVELRQILEMKKWGSYDGSPMLGQLVKGIFCDENIHFSPRIVEAYFEDMMDNEESHGFAENMALYLHSKRINSDLWKQYWQRAAAFVEKNPSMELAIAMRCGADTQELIKEELLYIYERVVLAKMVYLAKNKARLLESMNVDSVQIAAADSAEAGVMEKTCDDSVMGYREIIYQNVNTGTTDLMEAYNYKDYLPKAETMEAYWQTMVCSGTRVQIEEHKELSVEYKDGYLYIYLTVAGNTEVFTVELKKEKNIRVKDVTGNALVRLDYNQMSPIIMMANLQCNDALKAVGGLAVYLGIHYFCRYGGEVSEVLTIDNLRSYYNKRVNDLSRERSEIQAENNKLQREKQDWINRCHRAERDTADAVSQAISKVQEEKEMLILQNKQLVSEMQRLRTECKKNAKSEKYGLKKMRDDGGDKRACVSGLEQALADKSAELEQALAENRNLADKLSHSEVVCANKDADLAEAKLDNNALQSKCIGLEETLAERDKTIESQRRQIQELNRSAKFQPKEAQNITAEDMVRALQDRETIKHLERALAEEKKERKKDIIKIRELEEKIEQYEIYGFAKD